MGPPQATPKKVRKTLFMSVDNLKRKHVGHICSESISKFELYILGPLCCSVALTIMVKNNLSGALTVFGDYKLSVYKSTRFVLFFVR